MRSLLLCCLLFVTSLQAKPTTITLAADPWCPYNCSADSKNAGFMVDIARKILAKHGVTVRYLEVPWVRALKGAKAGDYDGVIGASRMEAKGFVFPDLPQGQMQNVFWVLKGSPWHYQGPASLRGKRLAIIAGYGYGPEIERYLDNPEHQNNIIRLYGKAPLANGIAMLEYANVDILLEDRSVMQYYLRQHPSQALIKAAGNTTLAAAFSDVYVAFSPAKMHSARYAKWLTKGMKDLRKTGELKTLLAPYGVQDWQKPK